MRNKEIDYALVEEKRPPIYTAMKYWGKKPHNIWREYIDCYTPKDGVFLDPFCGSAMSAFESVNLGRKTYALDLNPLSSFMIEVLSSEFNTEKFEEYATKILKETLEDYQYYSEYKTQCSKCDYDATIVNFKWDSDKIYEIAVECEHCKSRYTIEEPNIVKDYYGSKKDYKYWYPEWEFPKNDTFSKSFIKNIGGTKFSNLWTNRNLYVLSKIFNCIEKVKNTNIQKQLLFAFIQTVHLCSKMCVPRRKEANRDFSTSWGRSAYICAKRQMEMNPLYVFKNSCFGKQSVQSALNSVRDYMKVKPVICDINDKKSQVDNANLYYGIIDIKNIDKHIEEKSIDFILTDPPYGGLVKYFDLSSIWLSWLYKINKKYLPDYVNEITVMNDDSDKFYKDFLKGLRNLKKVIKDDGKIVFTFNNQDVKIWNIFLNAISDAGFKVEKVIHQQNKRTGESNVSSKFGMSSSDFYLRCIKSENTKSSIILNNDGFEMFVVNTITKIIQDRNEPTNYDILFAGLLSKLSAANFNIGNCDTKIEDILKTHIGKEFIIVQDNGNKWFLNNYEITGKTLSEKVKDSVNAYCNTHEEVHKDVLLGIIFKEFPNGLTPDPVVVENIINEIIKGDKNGKK